MTDKLLHPQDGPDFLALEEHHLRLFLTDVRPVGEEKSELYPEPQYFNTSWMAVGANGPYCLERMLARAGSAERYGALQKRVLARATALHFSGFPFLLLWGREMLMLEDAVPGRRPGTVFDDGVVRLTDAGVVDCLRFCDEAVKIYREDGRAYPSADRALGADYRILPPGDAQAVADRTVAVTPEQADEVLRLMASVRAISFLMEAETREALMMHGPYPVGDEGHQLVLFECHDLRWDLLTRFDIPGGARWVMPETAFPFGNIAIALVIKGARMTSDRFGTFYFESLSSADVVAAGLLTRGSDPMIDEGLQDIPVTEARSLRRLCDDVQEALFLQIATWDLRQRTGAGVMQQQTLYLRMLSAAGYDKAEVEAEQDMLARRCARVADLYFDKILNTPADRLPFYAKLDQWVGGHIPHLFSPLGE